MGFVSSLVGGVKDGIRDIGNSIAPGSGDDLVTVAEIAAIYYAPQMVGNWAATAAFNAGVATSTVLTVGTVAQAATSMFLVSQLASDISAGVQDPVGTAQASGMLINSSNNVAPLPVVYGRRRIGGTRTLVQVSGATNEYLHLVISLCEGEIFGLQEIYIDGTSILDPKFAGLVETYGHTGSDVQDADAILVSRIGSVWTSAHKGSGVAYIYLQLKFDNKAFSGFPTITADVIGKLVYDPRLGTTTPSSNPALCIRDYLTNSRYGRGISAALIDDASFIAAANYCDVQVAVPIGTAARYSCDGVINVDATPLDNLKGLLSCCRGMLLYTDGKYRLIIDSPLASSFAFTEDNITGKWSIATAGRANRFNRVTASFFNPSANWQADYAISDSSAYRAVDNGLLLEATVDLPFTISPYSASQLAGLQLKQSRFGLVCSFTAFQSAMLCTVGDVVSITHSTPGWSGKLFRVNQLTLLESDEIEVVCTEYDATVYNLDTLTAVTSTPTLTLPSVFTVPTTPTGLTLTSGTSELIIGNDGTITSRIKCVWTAPANIFTTVAEIQFQNAAVSTWQVFALTDASQGVAWITPVTDSVTYNVRIRFTNTIGVSSAWVTSAHTVVGKRQPPATVSSITLAGTTLTWPAISDVDVAGYRLKFAYGTSFDWGAAIPLHSGLITDSPYVMSTVPPGTVTIMIKAVDTTGNESLGAPYIITNLGNPLVANVVESYDFRAAAWPGTVTNGTPSGGSLQATQSDPFFKADAGQFFLTDAVTFFNTNYDAMTWVSSGWSPSSAAVGSNMTAAWTLIGDGINVKYRPTGPTSFFSAGDAAYFFGDDAAAFYSLPGDWLGWPGSMVAKNQEYQWQVTTAAGPTSGLLSAFTVSVDVPDKNLKVNNLAIAPGGTRITGSIGYFFMISNIQLTLQGGSTAVFLEITDKSVTLGPLITAKNSSGTSVAAVIDALLQGY
jgi:predicted phage tail protein